MPGGVVAIERTGYADPSLQVLAALSKLGGLAAVARSNIQGHERFGCARDGVVLFDAHEFMYIEKEEVDGVPSALRPLFDSSWVDLVGLDDDGDERDDDDWDGVVTAIAMAVEHTGVTFGSDDLVRASETRAYPVRTLTYR